jgi:ABC-type uncharacterized transport system permease subunit
LLPYAGFGIEETLTMSIIGTVLVGAVLARFYNVLILIPAFALVLAIIVGKAFYLHHGLLCSAVEFALLITSLQIGYVAIPISYIVAAQLRRIGRHTSKCSEIQAPIMATRQQ